ncbi:MAG: transposase [Myxococcota bacterium]
MLHRTLREHLDAFQSELEGSGRWLPGFVRRGFERFLECGILEHGFVRAQCEDCRRNRFVAFSCKTRGLCPSCGGRRMSETAAHLVDSVFPHVSVRQWVLSVPIELRYRMAFDAALCSQVLDSMVRQIGRHNRLRAKRLYGLESVKWLQTGSVTFIQRADSGLRLNVHFHSLVLDGVYQIRGPLQAPTFLELPPPTEAEVQKVALGIRRRVLALLGEASELDGLADAEPLLAECAVASVTERVATGAGRERWLKRVKRGSLARRASTPERCFNAEGFSLHANVAIEADDRRGLEKLCRYVARPPVANQRLEELSDGRIAYRLKRAWSDGTTEVVYEPHELIAKLVPLMPPPRAHQVRYHGILAPAASYREFVVPAAGGDGEPDAARRRNYRWAELMQRVFEHEVLECPECGGRMRIVATVTEPRTIRAILRSVGLAADSPPRGSATARRQMPLRFEMASIG